MYKDLHGWANCVNRFIHNVKQTAKMEYVPVGAIVGLVHLLQNYLASNKINSASLVNYNVDSDIYWTAYYVAMPESRCRREKCVIELYYSK